jgi:hypothetical protein
MEKDHAAELQKVCAKLWAANASVAQKEVLFAKEMSNMEMTYDRKVGELKDLVEEHGSLSRAIHAC